MNIKKEILFRVKIAFAFLLVISLSIVYSIFDLQFREGEYWKSKSENINFKFDNIKASRGNILSDDGSILATSLPFYKVACVIIDAEIFGISRKKDSHSMPDECVIIENERLLLSIIVNLEPKHDLDTINLVNWSINRKIMGDHLINIENQGQFRPHELGQDKNRVSFSKGCFRGQEIIARMEYLGKAKKETRLIIHVGEKEISKFTVIGETHEYQGKYFSSCLGKKEQFFD